MPGQVLGLGQALKFLSEGRQVSGKRPEAPLSLCAVGHGKRAVDSGSALGPAASLGGWVGAQEAVEGAGLWVAESECEVCVGAWALGNWALGGRGRGWSLVRRVWAGGEGGH